MYATVVLEGKSVRTATPDLSKETFEPCNPSHTRAAGSVGIRASSGL